MDKAKFARIDQHLATIDECVRDIDNEGVDLKTARVRTAAALNAISDILRLVTTD